MGQHQVGSKVNSASALTANPNLGAGNFDQIFVPNFENILAALYYIRFKNK
ncbi:MarR family transcriptional regulator [Pseudomonas savastanoi pv. retacarpa]|nr:MarR family transcriptional regulator [Pseudomonas savastanoi pv. retacarpa]